MSRRTIGVALLAAASVLLGLAGGQLFFGLFLKNIPPYAMSTFSQSAAHFAYLMYGLVFGVAIFALCIVAIFVARLFPSERARAASAQS